MEKTGRFLITAALVLFMVFGSVAGAMALSVKIGAEAPDFSLQDMDGNTVKLSDYKGKVVLLAFWASWCPRCMEELAFLQSLYADRKEELIVLAINQDTKNLSKTHVEKLKREVAQLGLEFPVLLDLQFSVWQDYNINALPTSVIIDPEGKVVFAEPNYYRVSQKKIKSVLGSLGIDVGSIDG
jgi:peroxiredoxin